MPMPATSSTISAANPSRRRSTARPSGPTHETCSVSTAPSTMPGIWVSEPGQGGERRERGQQERPPPEAGTGREQGQPDQAVHRQQRHHGPARPLVPGPTAPATRRSSRSAGRMSTLRVVEALGDRPGWRAVGFWGAKSCVNARFCLWKSLTAGGGGGQGAIWDQVAMALFDAGPVAEGLVVPDRPVGLHVEGARRADRQVAVDPRVRGVADDQPLRRRRRRASRRPTRTRRRPSRHRSPPGRGRSSTCRTRRSRS